MNPRFDTILLVCALFIAFIFPVVGEDESSGQNNPFTPNVKVTFFETRRAISTNATAMPMPCEVVIITLPQNFPISWARIRAWWNPTISIIPPREDLPMGGHHHLLRGSECFASHHHAAVHREDLTRDVIPCVAGQKQGTGGHIVRLAKSCQWNFLK